MVALGGGREDVHVAAGKTRKRLCEERAMRSKECRVGETLEAAKGGKQKHNTLCRIEKKDSWRQFVVQGRFDPITNQSE